MQGSAETRDGVVEGPTGRAGFRALVDHHPDAVVELDAEGRVVDGNRALARLAGRPVADLVGRPVRDLVLADDRPMLDDALDRARRGEPATCEVRGDGADGQVHDLEVLLVPVTTDGAVAGVQVLVRDVTVDRATRRALERNRALLRLAGDVARVGGWQYDAERDVFAWSEEAVRILDMPAGDAPTLDDVLALFPTEARAQVRDAVVACLDDVRPFDLEVPVEPAPGRRLWVRLVASPVVSPGGRGTAVRGVVTDIQQRRAAEAERHELAERLTAAFTSIPDPILSLDRDGRVTFVNARAAALLRRDRHTMLGRTLWSEAPALAGSELEHQVRQALASGHHTTVEEFALPDLDTWLEGTVTAIDGGVIVHLRDVTQARRAREELRDREARLREQAELLDQARDAIVVRDPEGRVTYWNRGAELLYGWSAEQAMGCRLRDLVFADPTPHDEATAEVWEAGEWQGELHPVDRDGRPHVVEARWTVVRGETGDAQAVLEIATEVTERRRVEQMTLRAQRMESLGTLASGMAHDLNNALSPTLMAVQLLRADISDQEREEILDLVEDTTRHGANLVEQVLSFARGVEGSRLPVDVAALIGEVARLVRDTFPPTVRWEAEVADDVWHVVGDATQLHQVLVNLAVNARDAMPDGGRLEVRATNVELDELPPLAPADSAPGPHVRLEVADTGTGMSAEVRDRVFEPFFTTKESGRGTGLGLATAHGIIESHGGFVVVESAPGQGTRFVVHLPASTDTSVPEGPRATTGPQGKGQRILLVEDQPGVRHSTARALRANGYQVVTAEDGESAIDLFRHDADGIALVLTDMMMPGIDGAETIRRVREVRPGVPAVLTSGLVDPTSDAVMGLDAAFLAKPYGTGALLEAVGAALASGSDGPE